jgi:hypothetical protein
MSNITHAGHHAHLAHQALHAATESDGIKGALAGGVAVPVSATAALALAGLALTPLGWIVLGTAGAAAGAAGWFKKFR